MQEQQLIALTGDKGGVGKSTIAILLAEWSLFQGRGGQGYRRGSEPEHADMGRQMRREGLFRQFTPSYPGHCRHSRNQRLKHDPIHPRRR